MKELSKKVFLLTFGIMLSVLIISFCFLNIQSYRREYESIKRSLNMMDDRGKEKGPLGGPEQKRPEDMVFMDQEVYTVEISDGSITNIINHGNESEDFDVSSAASEILSEYDQHSEEIGNLYIKGYAFSYRDNRIIIVNNEEVCSKLRIILLETIILFLVIATIVFFLSKLIAGWITKPAKEAFDKQREFIADASHELKTPLAVIMASSDEISINEENRKYIENIKFESDRMNKLISGMLDLSKLEEGVTRVDYKDENLSKIIEKTALTFDTVAFEKGVMIEMDIEDGITQKCSREEMEKLTSILIDNAIKHSYKNNAIQIVLKQNKSTKILEVTNTGDAIKEGEEEKIFERFYRSDKSRSRSENRYGLGLAIARTIVHNHNGTIKAKSKDGKTTFRVEF